MENEEVLDIVIDENNPLPKQNVQEKGSDE